MKLIENTHNYKTSFMRKYLPLSLFLLICFLSVHTSCMMKHSETMKNAADTLSFPVEINIPGEQAKITILSINKIDPENYQHELVFRSMKNHMNDNDLFLEYVYRREYIGDDSGQLITGSVTAEVIRYISRPDMESTDEIEISSFLLSHSFYDKNGSAGHAEPTGNWGTKYILVENTIEYEVLRLYNEFIKP